MRSQSLHPGSNTVVLDYSRTTLRRGGPGRWMRLFWSHRARLELAQTASCAEGVGVLAAISLVAGVLSTAHVYAHAIITHSGDPRGVLQMLQQEFSAHWLAVLGGALLFAPLCFAVLAGLLVLLAKLWTGLKKPGTRWSQTFPMLSVGCVPLLWFFVLLQVESVAPFVSRPSIWGGQWNPITNYLRFGALMIGIVLLGLWIIDAIRLYCSLRDRGTSIEPSSSPWNMAFRSARNR